ncbi:serine/threonine-protein kinase 19 isoform X2 [Myotis myotis]|uniref:serine/threonine-protein kinase 19 isoform X2 n=1 Tax=Myotis myotis TaxID=51298 RepID=UPI00174C8DD6|nr:serine/threonine-protein kinase 19 isoform X2 [Myotis myotis]
MSRKRPRPGAKPLGLRRRRGGGPAEAEPPGGAADARVLGGGAPPGSPPRPGSARAAVAELGRLFPRGLFEDALPPIALRSQVYSLVPDRTAADRQLKELQEQGEIRVIQLGFDLDAHGIVLTEDYRTRAAGQRRSPHCPRCRELVAGCAWSWEIRRQAVLGMVRKAKYRELLLSELLGRRAPASVRLGLAYHVHDLIGAQLVDCVSTTSGTLLRLPET